MGRMLLVSNPSMALTALPVNQQTSSTEEYERWDVCCWCPIPLWYSLHCLSINNRQALRNMRDGTYVGGVQSLYGINCIACQSTNVKH